MLQPEPAHFLDWTRPVALDAAMFLAGQAARVGHALDFAGHVAIVPTREAGRRLQEALVRAAGSRGAAGILPPLILTPESCLNFLAPPRPQVASRSASLLTLAEVLLTLPVERFSGLFPAPPVARNRDWSLNLAESFLRLRATLADSPDFSDCAAVSTHPENREPERWRDLAEIERRYRKRLSAQALVDAEDARRRTAEAPCQPDTWRVIWLVAVPDPTSLLPVALGRLHPVRVTPLIAAPREHRDGFDAWGRVVTDYWMRLSPDWADFYSQVQLAAHPDALAEAVQSRLPRAGAIGSRSTLGLLDAAHAPVLDRAVRALGGTAYNPAGVPMRLHAWAVLLRLWKDFLAEDSRWTLGELLRFPGLVAGLAGGYSLERVLSEYDTVCADHLPDSVADLRHFCAQRPDVFPALARTLDALEHWREECMAPDWTTPLARLLETISAETAPQPPGTAAVWEAIQDECGKLAALRPEYPGLATADWLDLLLRQLATQNSTTEAEGGAVPFLGWLELLWDDAPQLILAGLNEGAVPSTVTADPFLPGGFREKLGLRTNDARFACDVYILQKLLAQRANGAGRLDVVVLQSSEQGDPLRPSRLLFQCDPAALPGRVQSLFRDPVPPRSEPGWQAGWRFEPPVPPEAVRAVAQKTAVTRLASYLDCPFRFYLRHVLKMEAGDPWKSEPDAREFGTLLHDALDAFGRDETVRQADDPAVIEQFLITRLEWFLRRQYGPAWPLPVTVQAEAARNRLGAFARVQAGLRREGWEIHGTERSFEEMLGHPFQLDPGGPVISGKIDRVDFHPGQGWRIIDYKTSAKAASPEDAHLRSRRDDDGWPPEYARVETVDDKGKVLRKVWKNLQLPLYRHLFGAARQVPFEQVRLAYFNLPRALGDTGVYPWEGYTLELDESARQCVRGIFADLARRRFWPPNPRVEHDDFAALFFPDPEAVVDSAMFLEALEAVR